MSAEGMAEAIKRGLTPDSAEVPDAVKRARLDPEALPETAPSVPSTVTATAPADAEANKAGSFANKKLGDGVVPEVVSRMGLKPTLPIMPASLELVTGVKTDLRARKGFVGQEEVGIIGYAGNPDFKGVKGVIKQR